LSIKKVVMKTPCKDLIDTHCHLDAAAFADDHEAVHEQARRAGVTAMVVPGVSRRGWRRLLDLCTRLVGCYPALGLHPLYLEDHCGEYLGELERLIATYPVRAVGEIGLDFWDKEADPESQGKLFADQVVIAAHAKLPLILHVRKAHDQVVAMLRRLRFSHGGIVHSFSGSLQQAHRYAELGFCLGVSGTVTYERANRVRGVVAAMPLADLVLETDAPDIAPAGCRGERNSPANLPLVLEALSVIRSESGADIGAATSANARRLFGIGAID
jgi:TatD DNase family protein